MPVFKILEDPNGEFYWELRADGFVVAKSPIKYTTRQDCFNAVREVQETATKAKIR